MQEHPVTEIDLSAGKKELTESFLRMFGTTIQSILKAMFGGTSIPINVKGSRDQINSFADTLSSEKRYMDAYRRYGLDNPATYRSKFQLNRSVEDFERKTGIIWPFR